MVQVARAEVTEPSGGLRVSAERSDIVVGVRFQVAQPWSFIPGSL